MPTALVTNATQYAGPGVVPVLLRQGFATVCHDPSFVEAAERRRYEIEFVGTTCLAAQTPDEIAKEVERHAVFVDAVVSNDVHPIAPVPVEDVSIDDLRATFEAVVVVPFRLAQLFLPQMKVRRTGSLVFVTSARPLSPELGFAVPTSVRAAATAFAKALAREAAPFDIQVNAVCPNYLYSEMYYPRARFVDDPKGSGEIARLVPAGRLGRPEEIGELIAFLASGKSRFTTGQAIHFTGGWP